MRAIADGDNIRRAGEDVRSGESLAASATLLDTRHIALAAAAGFGSLEVLRKLRVAIVSVGEDLADSVNPLNTGQVYDCQRPMLTAALERPALAIDDHGILKRNGPALADFFRSASTSQDLVLVTGHPGYDEAYPARSLREAGAEIDITHVAIRPGKPFIHGRIAGTNIAVMPGNPFAALVAGLLFVRPIIEQRLGLPLAPFTPLVAHCRFAQKHAPARTEFMPARIVGHDASGIPIVEILGRGGSSRLKPLIDADGLAVIAPGVHPVQPGEAIGFLPFGAAFTL